MVEQHMPVCVFDLDHTLTCGNAKQAIERETMQVLLGVRCCACPSV